MGPKSQQIDCLPFSLPFFLSLSYYGLKLLQVNLLEMNVLHKYMHNGTCISMKMLSI